MEKVKVYLEQIQKEASLAVALLDALRALDMYNKTHVRCGSQLLLLDFTEEIEILKSALTLLHVDPKQAMEEKVDGSWFG